MLRGGSSPEIAPTYLYSAWIESILRNNPVYYFISFRVRVAKRQFSLPLLVAGPTALTAGRDLTWRGDLRPPRQIVPGSAVSA